MTNSEFEHSLEELNSVRYSRRDILKRAALLPAYGAAAVSGLGMMGRTFHAEDQARQKATSIASEKYPPLSPEVLEKVEQYNELHARLIDLTEQGKYDEVKKVLSSQEFKEAMQASLRDKARRDAYKDLYQELYANEFTAADAARDLVGSFVGMIATCGAGAATIVELNKLPKQKKKYRLSAEMAKNRLLAVRPDWEYKPPSPEEIFELDKKLSYLPPVGGKIPYVKNGTLPITKTPIKKYYDGVLPPTWTPEEQVNIIAGLLRNGELGAGYVHQITVQGRLPDRFKFAALAMLTNSPYVNDWKVPFFDTWWGSVAPLVHDGGQTENNTNPFWKGVEGRTDYLLRITGVDEAEEHRLMRETKFYQRAAFLAHCFEGTTPNHVPQEVQEAGSECWQEFENRMKWLLTDYGEEQLIETPWFTSEPNEKHRFEAEWAPIQSALQQHEEIRWNRPELIYEMTTLMDETSYVADQAIGLI